MTPAELDAIRRRAAADAVRSDPTAVGMAQDVLALLGELDVHRETGRLARNHVRQLIAVATGGSEGEFDPYAPSWVPATMWAELKTLVVEHRAEIGRLADLLAVSRTERDVARTESSRYRIEVEASQLQVRDLADLLDAARTERDSALIEAAELKDQAERKIKALRTQIDLLIDDRSERIGEALQLGADLAEANSQRDLLRRRVQEVIVERDTALIARDDARRIVGEWEAEIDRRDATVRKLRRSRRKMRNRYEKILADDQAVVTGLRAGMTVLRGRLNDADGSVRILADEAQAEADVQSQRIAKLRRSRAKWRRRAGRVVATRIGQADAQVVDAAVGWYRTMPTMPDSDIFSRQELALHAAVAAWLQTPAAPAEPVGETPAGLDAQERTSEAAERISAAPSDNPATFHGWLAAGAVCGYGNSGTPVGLVDDFGWKIEESTGGSLPRRKPGAGLRTDGGIGVEVYPIIIDGGDADTYLAGLFNAEAATLARLFNAEASPVPVDRADPDGAADDDWTSDEPDGGEWRHRDPNNSSTLTANTYPYGGGHPDHGVQITIERDRPGPGDPDRRTWQCLRLPHPNAIGLALWILAHYDEWSDIPADRAALDDIGDILNTASGYLEDDSPIVARLTAYLRDRQAQLDDWIGHNQRIRDALGIGPNEDTIAAIRRLRDDDESEPLREL